ncbi:hypothetical protein KDA_13670 [Dictyobacter alpinus]|uniref:Uncharacterized protein n=1 Tax=Dictyobacter alpinus TaxID=2014873 RepID=A0A402B3G7_9CHLR|nr:hypothetical protein KDA_13670 [Dictyobacter alpinus]
MYNQDSSMLVFVKIRLIGYAPATRAGGGEVGGTAPEPPVKGLAAPCIPAFPSHDV